MRLTTTNATPIIGLGLKCDHCREGKAIAHVIVKDFGDGNQVAMCLCSRCAQLSTGELVDGILGKGERK